jgi:glycolate oxidase iron-sulfur subunit
MDQTRISELIDACVHCGFCLPACPTYQLWGEEMDSPRGRIQLMKLHQGGEIITEAVSQHYDRCLGCMACVSACPSGVRYDRLITATRAQVETEVPRTVSQRILRGLIFGLFPYPRRLRLIRPLLRAAQRLRADRPVANSAALARRVPGLAAMAALAPRLGARWRAPSRVPPHGPRRAVVGVLLGCVQREFFSQVNAATVRVLAAEGCEVVIPPQGCCGALSSHSGRHGEAAGFARRTIAAFERAGVDTVVVNAAGCGSAMKEYGELLADDLDWSARAEAMAAKVRDFSEFLAALGPVAARHELPVTIAYHDACHLSHAQGVRSQPRELLTAIPGVRLLEIAGADQCCGSAGVYNLLQAHTAAELGAAKAAAVSGTGAQLLVSANPGCAMQIARGLARQDVRLPMAQLAEVLDASIAGRQIGSLPG